VALRAAEAAAGVFVRFPPGWQNVLVPITPRGATALGTTLYTASRRGPLLAQRALWAVARAGGARFLPGPREHWNTPVEDPAWTRLWEAWSDLLGGVDGLAIYERPQRSRTGLLLALWNPGASLVVRLRHGPSGITAEQRVASSARELGAVTFRVPRVLGQGTEDGWHWVASEGMASRPHRPVLKITSGLLAEVAATVERGLERPAVTPSHWRPAHGDLTPWNLRRAAHTTWLIDWEDAGWAPPNADAVYFEACAQTLGVRPARPARTGTGEARNYWREKISARTSGDADAGLQARLLDALAMPERG